MYSCQSQQPQNYKASSLLDASTRSALIIVSMTAATIRDRRAPADVTVTSLMASGCRLSLSPCFSQCSTVSR